jgi:hypothetical protein
MFNHRRKMLLLASLALVLAGPYAPVAAQIVKGLNDNIGGGATQHTLPSGEGPSQFLLDPDAQIKGDTIKQQTFRSDPAGQNKNWNLDIGRFQGDYRVDPNSVVSPSRALEDLDNDTFSGVRLRLPFRGRTGQ